MALIVNAVSIVILPRILNSFDVPFHIGRVVGAWGAWHSGQMLPYVNPWALHGLGLGSNYFYGTWQAFLLAPIYGLTHSVAVTFTVFNIVATVIAGVLMDKLLRQFFHGNAVMVASSFYMASPFMVHNLFVTQDQGAIIGIALLPMIFIGVFRILKDQANGIAYLAIGAALMLSSHLLSTFLAVVAVIIVLIWAWRELNLTTLIRLGYAGLLALALSAFFWVPLIELKSLDLYNVFFKNIYVMDRTAAFLTKSNSWQPYSKLIKVVNGLALLGSMGLIFKWSTIKDRADEMQFKLFKLSLGVTALFAFLSYAPLNWRYLPGVFANLQFLWRFMYIGYFFMAFILAVGIEVFVREYVSYGTKAKVSKTVLASLAVTLILALGQTFQYAHSVRHAVKLDARPAVIANGFKAFNPHSKSDAWYFEYASTGVYLHQNIITNPAAIIAKHNVTTADVTTTTKNTNRLISANVAVNGADNYLVFKKVYYPGYYIRLANGQHADIKATHNKDGLVAVRLPANYQGGLKLGFQAPLLYVWMWAVSLCTLVMTLAVMLRQRNLGGQFYQSLY
ncbi:hypothetical protein [Periweissella ghanensis]|uniref:Membrane protein 6-pyruvoyl-tetrahydropterin synthase-related domain-containing protein n=1 Tax=Periweissella ghanensis TaxID=467997 RepID=A0ABN8BNB6_9LACO|nr:hypothetical protein [Periweissella ghanensis]MCM0600922.1 hypothetical protein [Periweissella ghanensis]CAH0417660.1 hypothetical protein WGH24286_00072 [Periweissella ghanensis]